YAIPKPGNVSVQLYSVDGRFIQTLDNGYHQTGNYTIRINTKHLASGTYIVILKTKTGDATRPAIVIH
ncbi:MAG: T9SS type A sorting domain-containing protein, partial [bacterium]